MFSGLSFHIDGFSISQKLKLKKLINQHGGSTNVLLKKSTSFVVSDTKSHYKLQQATKYGVPVARFGFIEECIKVNEVLSNDEGTNSELFWVDDLISSSANWEYNNIDYSVNVDTVDIDSSDQRDDAFDEFANLFSSDDFLEEFGSAEIPEKGSKLETINAHMDIAGKEVDIWGHGENGRGQLATGDKLSLSHPRYSHVVSTIVRESGISCLRVGSNHCALLTGSGNLYTWGSGKNGVLGRDSKIAIPTRISMPRQVTHVSCGSEFTVCVDCDNVVWSWGSSKYIGRDDVIGKRGSTRKKPGIVKSFSEQVTQLSSGSKHTILSLQGGKTFGWGSNESGQLNFQRKNHIQYPQEIESLSDKPITAVHCGADFTIFLSSGVMYSCGNNRYGQLGRPTKGASDFSLQPIEPFSTSRIVHISCGEDHSACLTEDMTVWMWGCGTHGRFGKNDSTDIMTPRKSTLCSHDKFVFVACGTTSTYLITDTGMTYAIGGSLEEDSKLYNTLQIDRDEYSKYRVMLVDVDSIYCGRNFALFAIPTTSASNLHQHSIYGNEAAVPHAINKFVRAETPPLCFSKVFGDPHRSPVIYATLFSHSETVRSLLQHGADEIVPRTNFGSDNTSALHVAAVQQSAQMLQILASHCSKKYGVTAQPQKSPINLVISPQGSPLHISVNNFDVQCVKLLLQNKAFVDICDKSGTTPLHCALINAPYCEDFMGLFSDRRDLRIVQLLIQSGANIYAADNLGNTPLSLALSTESKIIEDWANAIDVLIISEQLNDDTQYLEYHLKSNCFICKCATLNDKTIKEQIDYAKVVCLFVPNSVGTDLLELTEHLKVTKKYTIIFCTPESKSDQVRFAKHTFLEISNAECTRLIEIVSPVISKLARKQRMKMLEERLNRIVNLSMEEIYLHNQAAMSANKNTYSQDFDYIPEDNVDTKLDSIREIRLFLSSTFRDMFHEREQLVKHAFPELSMYCHKNSLFFTEVDLRWGITAAQAQQGEVLNICLGEVDRCRPYFCCILGERYGWYSNPAKPDPLLERTFQKAAVNYPWIMHYSDRSVTELEIQHAVLNDPSSCSSTARFYFKDPSTFEKKEKVKEVKVEPPKPVEEEKPLFTYAYTNFDFKIDNTPTFGQEAPNDNSGQGEENLSESMDVGEMDNDADDELAARKLEELKQRIIDAGCSVQYYHSPEELAAMIVKDFSTSISEKIEKPTTTKAPMDAEISLHHAYASNKARFFAGREKYLTMLDDYVLKTDPLPFVVVNEVGGMGQSALLAKFAEEHTENHPSDIVIAHYISASSDSSEISNIQMRLLHEIKHRCGIEHELSEHESNPSKLLEELEVMLGLVANKLREGKKRSTRKLIILIDGLHVVDQNSAVSVLSMLPHSFPAGVRAIFSTQLGTPSYDICCKRKYLCTTLTPFKQLEIAKVVENFLGHYCKSLSPSQTSVLITKAACTNSLFLRTVLEELRIFGIFEELSTHINFLLSATTIDKLYNIILGRLESDFGTRVKELFISVLTALWGARDGLSETEIRELFNHKNYLEQDWKAVFHGIQRFVVNISGFEVLATRHIRQAIENTYLQSAVAKKNVHHMLAGFFAAQRTLTIRKATQLPYHYLNANSMSMLKTTLSNLEIFRILISDEVLKPKLLSWWRVAPGGYESAYESYEHSLAQYFSGNPPQDEKYDILFKLAHFCKEIQDYKRAEAYMKRACNIAELIYENQPIMANTLMDLVGIMSLRYTFAAGEEEALLKKALTIRKAVFGENSEPAAEVLEILAKFYRGRRDYYSSELFFQQAIKIREKVHSPDHPSLADALTGMAWIYQRQHKFKLAIELGARVIDLLETAYGSTHPEVALAYTNYGLLLNSQDQMTKASTFLKAALTISEQLYGKESKNANQLRVYLVNVYTKQKKTEEIKQLTSLIAQYEEEAEKGPFTNPQNDTSAPDQAAEENTKRVIKVTLGNDMDLLDESESSGKTAGEVQKNRNRWTVFVRSPDPEFTRCISSVEFRFHPDWMTRGAHKGRLDSNIVKIDTAPYEFSGIGWPPIHGLPKEHREDLFKIVITINFNEKFKCEPMQIPYELVLPIKTEMATTETTGSGREIAYEFIQEHGRAFLIQFLGKSAADPGGWIDRL